MRLICVQTHNVILLLQPDLILDEIQTYIIIILYYIDQHRGYCGLCIEGGGQCYHEKDSPMRRGKRYEKHSSLIGRTMYTGNQHLNIPQTADSNT